MHDPLAAGNNQYGYLGDGTLSESHVPIPSGLGSTLTQLATMNVHVCGIQGATGPAYCWGASKFCVLGGWGGGLRWVYQHS